MRSEVDAAAVPFPVAVAGWIGAGTATDFSRRWCGRRQRWRRLVAGLRYILRFAYHYSNVREIDVKG
jgi:hypothetical protein